MQQFDIYLDHAATSIPRSQVAIDAANIAMNLGNANRGLHSSANTASKIIINARESIAKLVGASLYSHTVSFTANTTTALNQAILGLRPKPRCIGIDPLSHNATYRPVVSLSRNHQTQHWTLPHDSTGKIDIEQLSKTWVNDTDVVIITHASNVNGIIQPVAPIIELAHSRGAVVIVDAAQTIGLINTIELAEADLIAFGAHKGLRGLPGVGALVCSVDITLEPLIYGGTGTDSISVLMPARQPARIEAGTMNLPAIAAFGAVADDFLTNHYNYQVSAADLVEAVKSGGGIVLPTECSNVLPVVSFTLPSIPTWEATDILDRCFNIQLRAGLHCAPIAHNTLGTFSTGALRVSSGYTTTSSDLLSLSEAIHSTCKSYEIFLDG